MHTVVAQPVTTHGDDDGLERRAVVALFVDVSGFTAMVETGDVEEVRDTMRAAFDAAAAEVRSRGGTVEKFIGDAMLALFGAGRAHRDDVDRAVTAAAAIAERLGTLPTPLAMRAGIELGEVLVDRLRLETARDLMVVGDAVNTAARLQQAAVTGEVLIGPAAAALCSASLGEPRLLSLKGKERALLAHPVLAAASAAVRRSPFVGRERERKALADALDAAAGARRPVTVAVVGPPGIGKTRLVEETLGAVCRSAACAPPGEGSAADVLRSLTAPDAGAATGEPWVEALTSAHAARGGAEATEVAGVLAVTSGVRRVAGVTSSLIWLGRLDDAVAAWRAYLTGLAGRGAIGVVIDDAQWAPDDLVVLLTGALSGLEAPLLVVLCAWEAQALSAWATAGEMRIVELGPLESADLRYLAEAAGHPPATIEGVVAAAEGNPLYVATVRPDEGDALPLGVRAAVTARLDSLDPALRQPLRAAAVLGRHVAEDAVGALADDDDAAHTCRRLCDEGLMVPVAAGTYAWTNHLVTQTVYASLTRRERQTLHGRAADWMETSGAPDHADRARHLDGAGRAEPAVAAYVVAADDALRRLEVREADRLLERALTLVDEDTDRERAADLHLRRGHVLFAGGDAAASRTSFDRAHALASGSQLTARALAGRATMTFWQLDLDGAEADARAALGLATTSQAQAEAEAALALVHSAQGRPGDAIAHALAGRRHAAAAGLPALAAMSGMVEVLVNHHAGRSLRAARLVDGVAAACRQAGLPVPLVWGLYKGGLAHAALGDFASALRCWDELTVVAGRTGNRQFLAETENCRGHLAREVGADGEAEEHDHRSATASLELSADEAAANALLNLAAGAVLRSDFDGVRTRLDQARPLLDARSWYRWRYSQRYRYYACLLHIESDDLDRARRIAEESLALGRQAGSGKNTLRPMLLLHTIQAHSDPRAAAEGLRRTGRDAARLGLRPIAWRAWASAAELLDGAGDATGASRVRALAVRTLSSMAADVPPDRRELFMRHVAAPVEQGRRGAGSRPL